MQQGQGSIYKTYINVCLLAVGFAFSFGDDHCGNWVRAGAEHLLLSPLLLSCRPSCAQKFRGSFSS